MRLVRGLALALVLAAQVTASEATDSVNGRWAVDASYCTRLNGPLTEQPLIVTDNNIRWSSDACRIERSYKTGDTVHIQAKCWGEGGEKSIPVSLRPHGGRLAVTWDRGPRGDLRRCP